MMNQSDYLRENFSKWQQAAEKGDAGAKYNLALCYIYGKDIVKRDRFLAYDLLCEACGRLNPETQRKELGYAYYNRAITAIHLSNLPEAISSLQNAVNYGYLNAYLPLLNLSSTSDYYDEDLFREMQKVFPACAMYFEGLNSLIGRYGYPKNEQKAIELFTLSAEQGYKIAADILLQLFIGEKWMQEGIGLLDKIQHLLPLASEEYAGWAAMQIGFYLMSGINCELDGAKACNWFGMALDTYNYIPAAMQALALMLEMAKVGGEVDTDYIKTSAEIIDQYPELSEDQTNGVAILGLAEIYEEGKYGIEKDCKKALDLYRKAKISIESQLAVLATEDGKKILKSASPLIRKVAKASLDAYVIKAKNAISRIENQL